MVHKLLLSVLQKSENDFVSNLMGFTSMMRHLHHMCFYSFCERVGVHSACGGIHIESLNWLNNTSLSISPVRHHSLNIYVIQFNMMYSPQCEVNHLEITRYGACDDGSRYCGHLPSWNESSPTSKLEIKLRINWVWDQVQVVLHYGIQNSNVLTILEDVYISSESLYSTSPMQSFPECTWTMYLTAMSYSSLIAFGTSFMHGELVYEMHDGPGSDCLVLQGALSSSHKILVMIEMTLDVNMTSTHALYASIVAPITMTNASSIINSSSENIFYQVLAICKSESHCRHTDVRILHFNLHGYRGKECEYAGKIVLANISDKLLYGPYCQPLNYSFRKIPYNSHQIVLYSYRPYAYIFLQYEINTDASWGIIHPLFGEINSPGISYKSGWTEVHWPQTRGSGSIVFLPHGRPRLDKNKATVVAEYTSGYTSWMIQWAHSSYCQVCGTSIIDWGMMQDISIDMCDSHCFDPILVLACDQTKPPLLKQKYVPYDIQHPFNAMCQIVPRATISVFARTSQHNRFALLEFENTSCKQTFVKIKISQLVQNIFLLTERIIWKSYDGSIKFALYSIAHEYCFVNVTYHTKRIDWCTPHWSYVSRPCMQQCSTFSRVINSHLTSCMGLRCYKIFEGGIISWREAAEMCADKGSTLVTINSYEELDAVTMILHRYRWRSSWYLFLGLILEKVSVKV